MLAFLAALFTVTNVAQFEAALVNAQDGDRIYLQAGSYAPTGTWVISKSLEIFGDGMGEPGHEGTVIHQPSLNAHVFQVVPAAADATSGLENVYIHDLAIQGTYPGSGAGGTGDGIRVETISSPQRNVDGIRIARVMIRNVGRDGFHVEGANMGPLAINNGSIVDSHAVGCGGSGLWMSFVTLAYALGSNFADNQHWGVNVEGVPNFRLFGCSLGLNFKTSSPQYGRDFNGQLRLKLSHGFAVIGNYIEEFDNNIAVANNGVVVENCFGGVIEGNGIVNSVGSQNAGTRGIIIESLSRNIQVGSNQFGSTDTLVKVQWDSPTLPQSTAIILPQGITEASDAYARGLVSVPTSLESGSVVFVPAKTGAAGDQEGNWVGGIALPRITSTTRDGLHAIHKLKGLQIYNASSNKISFWDGSVWRSWP